MPQPTDLRSIMVIGSGPIVIGQDCEFDYSGTQACKVLRALGYRVILINSNLMTDPDIADTTYIEPLTVDVARQIIERERPDAILPTVGGQNGFTLAAALHHAGVLTEFGVELIGANPAAIGVAADRELFKAAMEEIGIGVPRAGFARSVEDAERIVKDICLPAVIRPSFTLGGAGGGIAYTMQELRDIVAQGLDLSPNHQVLVEESVLCWKEFELDVIRDADDNCVIICFVENVFSSDEDPNYPGCNVTLVPLEYERDAPPSPAVSAPDSLSASPVDVMDDDRDEITAPGGPAPAALPPDRTHGFDAPTRRPQLPPVLPWWRVLFSFVWGGKAVAPAAPLRVWNAPAAPIRRSPPVARVVARAVPPSETSGPYPLFLGPAPWEGAEALVDPDLGTARRRLAERLYQLREEAPSRSDWRFVDRLMRTCMAPRLDFPLFPAGALRLHRLLRTGEPAHSKVVEVVRTEPGMVQRVWLEARFGVAGAVRPYTLDEAIVRIGQRRLWELAMSACMNAKVFQVRSHQDQANHLRQVSIVAAEVSATFAVSGDPFLPSLLHGLGQLVVYRCGPGKTADDSGSPAFVAKVARQVHPSVGVLMAEAWDLGPALAVAVGFAPAPAQAPPAYRDIAVATRAASIAAHESWAEQSGQTMGGFQALRGLGFSREVIAAGLDTGHRAWRKATSAE